MTDTAPDERSGLSRMMSEQLKVVQEVDLDQNLQLDAKLTFKIKPELIRFIAYLFFWTMCILAIILTSTIVGPLLLEGPTDGKACPPFETGEGFDITTDSHLIRIFGFNNICSNWDYSPSREITAAYYPAFEYSLLFYILADYLTVSLYYKKGLVSRRFYLAFKICSPFLVIFSSWFRLIFVNMAYINVSAHIFGFLTLQIVLIAVASFNVWFIIEAKLEYKMFCGKTKLFALTFLVCNLTISGIKIYLTGYVVAHSGYPSWATTPISGEPGTIVPGQIIDYIWMIFNAIIPLVMSLVRSMSENPLEITVDFMPLTRKLEEGGGAVVEDREPL